MKPHTLCAVYFSATGGTRTVVTAMARRLAEHFDIPVRTFDMTLPDARSSPLRFSPGDLVLLGVPVYAGRVPNLLLPYIASLEGGGALGVPLVLYGNRSFDDALMELRNTMEATGFHTVAAGAFIGEHSFSRILAGGRPDASDQTIAKGFADQVYHKLQALAGPECLTPLSVPGNDPVGPYFRPQGPEGTPIDIRRVRPLTRETCTDCLWCVDHCPMGSISREDPRLVPGICIKCNACVKGCPTEAKYFADPNYLFHRDDIVARYQSPRKEPACFL